MYLYVFMYIYIYIYIYIYRYICIYTFIDIYVYIHTWIYIVHIWIYQVTCGLPLSCTPNSVGKYQWKQSRAGLLRLPRLAGGIPPPGCCHWGHRCWNLQGTLQPDLLCRVMRNRVYIFTLFTKKASLTSAKYHCKSISQQPWSWYIFV